MHFILHFSAEYEDHPPMFYMQKSFSYDLEYSFCQSDTFPELKQAVIDEGGVCTVCAANWLIAKAGGNQWVFSKQSIFQNKNQYDVHRDQPTTHDGVFKELIPSMQMGAPKKIKLDKTGGQEIADALGGNWPNAIICLSCPAIFIAERGRDW